MIATALTAALFFVAPYAYATLIYDEQLASGLVLGTLFKAIRTGVLEVDRCFNVDWLNGYKLFPTKESVDRFERLLFKSPAWQLNCDSERCVSEVDDALITRLRDKAAVYLYHSSKERAAASPQSVLMTKIREHLILWDSWSLVRLLVNYAIFKTHLYGGLGQSERRTLKLVFSVGPAEVAKFEQLVDELGRAGSQCELCVASTANWSSDATMGYICSDLRDRRTDAPIESLEACVESCERGHLEIPPALLQSSSSRCHHALSWLPRPCSEGTNEACLERTPGHLHGGDEGTRVAGDCSPAKMHDSNPEVFPKEVWFMILLHHLDLSSQVRVVPTICKLWKSWHRAILNESSTVKKAFAEDVGIRDRLIDILSLACSPWNYFLTSPLTVLKYLFCHAGAQIQDKSVGEKIRHMWSSLGPEINGSRPLMPSNSYLTMYLGCCKAASASLELYQLPGMSDTEYAALVKRLIDQHGIVPAVSRELLERDCGRLVQMLKDDSKLTSLLFRGSPKRCNTLTIHLSSAKFQIPPEIAAVLEENSELYRALFKGDNSLENSLHLSLRDCLRDGDEDTIIHGIIAACLLVKPDGDPKVLKALSEDISRCLERGKRHDSTGLLTKRSGVNFVVFLYKNRKSYSEEELGNIEQVFGHLGLWSASHRLGIFEECIPEFMSDPQFTIKLADWC